MNPLDASFLYLENGVTHMHIGSVGLFEGPAPDHGRLLELFAAKLPLVPRYRQRVRFVPFDLGRPVWVDDRHFDLGYHVRHCALAPPGGEAELDQLVGRLMSTELDRRRPLWEAWVVEGLAGGRWALISKVHHCMVDGVAGVDLVSLVLDSSPDGMARPANDDWQPEPEPASWQLAADALVSLATSPGQQLRALQRALRGPRRTLEHARDIALGLRAFTTSLRATPPTSLDGPRLRPELAPPPR